MKISERKRMKTLIQLRKRKDHEMGSTCFCIIIIIIIIFVVDKLVFGKRGFKS